MHLATLLLLLSVILCWSTSFALDGNEKEDPQDITDPICNGRPRTACEVQVDVPAVCATDPSKEDPECPIVFFLHGSGGSIVNYKRNKGVHEAGMIGIYVQGEGGWNTGPKSQNKCDWYDYSCTEDPDGKKNDRKRTL